MRRPIQTLHIHTNINRTTGNKCFYEEESRTNNVRHLTAIIQQTVTDATLRSERTEKHSVQSSYQQCFIISSSNDAAAAKRCRDRCSQISGCLVALSHAATSTRRSWRCWTGTRPLPHRRHAVTRILSSVSRAHVRHVRWCRRVAWVAPVVVVTLVATIVRLRRWNLALCR